jgi:UDP-N-acetylmuramyl pentapeptide phosphotransferase/UDP-N-acetylglucosamine-1-phosphate transferase
MEAFWIAFVLSALTCALVLRTARLHARFTADGHSGPQKRHVGAVPRVGGVGLMAGLLCGALALVQAGDTALPLLLLLAALPAFGSGLVEDLTKRVSPRLRLACALLAAALGILLLDARIYSAGIPGLDALLAIAPFAVGLTLIAVAGVCNAVNIVDGFNGLASGCVLLMLAAIAWVAFAVGDASLGRVAVMAAGAVLGFMVWNYPHGRIFLGDGGAYLLGFVVVELALLLVLRNPSVSPLLPLLVCAYPVVETLFTIARRLRGGISCAFLPDGLHLHSLIYRRLTRAGVAQGQGRSAAHRNARTSPYLWALCALSLLPVVLAWNHTWALAALSLSFVAVYLASYRAVVRFCTPRWLRLQARASRAAPEMADPSVGV